MQQFKTSHREHRELGEVTWLRDFDHAISKASTQDKPIMLLFQEVPGCATCVNYGQDVLAHPLIVELIESEFVPLAIFNNHPGPDAEILKRFGEPAWNNPVVHVLRPDGSTLHPRLSSRYDPLSLYAMLTNSLDALGREIPAFAMLLYGDLLIETGLAETATYETPCFWSGETSLVQAPGVISTDAGWIDGEEVVKVQFDPRATSRGSLDEFASGEGFRPRSGGVFEIDREPQYYLRKSAARHLPLSASQRSRINLAVPYKTPIEQFLSPKQLAWLNDERLEQSSHDETYRQDIRQSWGELAKRLAHPTIPDSMKA